MNKNNQNTLLAIVLWLACMLALYWLFPGVMGARRAPSRPATDSQPQAPVPPAAPVPQSKAAAPADVPRETRRSPRRLLTLETPRSRVTVTSEGAAVESVQLLGDRWTRHKGDKEKGQVDLVERRPGEPLPLSTVVRGGGEEILVPADASYDVVKQEATSATFRTERGGIAVTKTLSIEPQTYGIRLAVEVQSTAALAGRLSVLMSAHAEEPQGGFFGSRAMPARAICLAANDKVERLAIGSKDSSWDGQGTGFAGIDEQYFLTAVTPPPGAAATCHLEAQGQKSGVLVAVLSVPLQVGAGASMPVVFTGYAGPKDADDLNAVAAPLRHAIDWGFWSVIAELLLGIMKFFHAVVPGHNWGVAIILLTLAMKLLTFPLQHKSMKSMQEMQRIQPQLEQLKKKYAGDTQRQNLEQMKLFKEHGVNPMGSCLPLLIQMPIWFALYTTLQVSVELYNAPFIHGWIDDLTSKDPYYVLPVAMGATMILTQLLTPTPMSNPSQKTMSYVMTAFFSVIMLNLPSGLTLYIFTNNLLSIAQQMYLRRTIGKPPASGATVEVKPAAGGTAQRAKAQA